MQELPFGDLLKAFRKQQHLSQQALAEHLGVHRNTIGSWEQGVYLPDSRGMVVELARQLHLDEQQTRQLLQASLTAVSSYWQVPFTRNPFFTGREEVLTHLHTMLSQSSTIAALTQSYALHGLGGIGKTQLAVEYAYRHRYDYEAVLWIQAETQITLTSSFVVLAELLALPEKAEEDQSKVVAAVLRWLNRHKGWLLIFDNVDDLALLNPFFPSSDQGSLLLTTRLQTLGTLARTVELSPMTVQEGIAFLLTRPKHLHRDEERASTDPQEVAAAQAIVAEMGGLPLALEQAGAYIAATHCNFSDYLQLLQTSKDRLLDEHEAPSDHPLSVNKTFTLAFERLEQHHPAAAELLTVCSFLAPEAIPDTFFFEGATQLGSTFETLATDPFQFHDAIKVLLSYSLLQRHTVEHMVTMHRLVQAVLKGRLSPSVQRLWARRVVEAMSQIFPSDEVLQSDYWQACERLLPHALVCSVYGKQWDEDQEPSISLMNHMATYLSKRAHYAEAEMFFENALQRTEQKLGAEHPLAAEALHGRAEIFREQGRYTEAVPLFQRALRIREQAFGTDHLLMAASLDRLGNLYLELGKYEQAESLFHHALQIWEHKLGLQHPLVAQVLNGLGLLYWEQGKYELAEPLYRRSLHIREQTLGAQHPLVARVLNNLGLLYMRQGQYELAEPLYQRSLSIREQILGLEHPQLAYPLTNLGILYIRQGQYELAEPPLQRALHLREQAFGSRHPLVAYPLNVLAELYTKQGQYEQAELLYQRALQIREQAPDSQYRLMMETLNGLAELYTKQGKYEQAEPLYLRCLAISEKAFGPEHLETCYSLHGLANLYKEQGKHEQAEPLYRRSLALRQQRLGSEHPEVADILHDLAHFHQLQQQNRDALSLYQQALTIREQALGPHHPKTEETRRAYAQLLRELGREAVAASEGSS